MKPLTDEELILHYYGETEDGGEIERRLAASASDRVRFAELSRVLDAVAEVPAADRGADYGVRVWRRLEPRLDRRRPRWRIEGLGWRPRAAWALAAAVALLVGVSFWAGLHWPRAQMARTTAAEARERVLLVTVAGHLERTEMLLLELVNERGNGGVDLAAERRRAGDLSGESRLYRQAAARLGQRDVAAILDEIERLLIDIAHGPDEASSAELGELRLRLEERDLLFRVRVVGSTLRTETRTGPGAERFRGKEI